VFGWLSDKIGRKPIIMAGLALAVVSYFPLFEALTRYANPALYAAQKSAPVIVVADLAECAPQFDPIGRAKFVASCDIAKSYLTKAGVSYATSKAPAGATARIMVGEAIVTSYQGAGLAPEQAAARQKAFKDQIGAALKAAGYPAKADSAAINRPIVVAILALLVLYVTMVYGPIAAMLVEMFPTRIRYTSMSLPYHIGNGWAGGLLPAITFMMITNNGNIYFGLWYPIVIAATTLVIGLLFVPETRNANIDG